MATISEIFEAEKNKKQAEADAYANMTREEKIRKFNPGLQELWEQYQTMLKLVDDGSLPPDIDRKAAGSGRKRSALLQSQKDMMEILRGA